jgi:CheY-like chemotaxis protein
MPKHILLVEDSVTMQKVVQIAFAKEDYQIVSTTSADEALARCKEQRPDIVLADTSLPGKSGYDLSQALRADPSMKDVPVLLLTGNFNPYDEARAQKSGIDAYIVKPFDTQSIIDKVNGLMKGRPASAPSAAPAASAAKPAPAATPAPVAQVKPATPAQVQAPAVKPAAAAQLPVTAADAAARSTLIGVAHQAQPVTSRPAPVASPVQSAPARPAAASSGPTQATTQASQDGASAPRMEQQMPQMPRPSLIPRAPVPAPVLAALERIASRGPEYEAIAKLSVEAIQQIVWEVVPELAEVMIRAEVERLAKERKA